MKGPSGLAVTALALLLALSVLGNSSGAPQRLFERRNWTPQAMLYLKGAQGRRFISDQSRRKELADRPPPERRNLNLQPLTLPEAVALLLASLQKPQKDVSPNPSAIGTLKEERQGQRAKGLCLARVSLWSTPLRAW
ncbi:spexin [Phodopus roborovskii]|uniref:LOW QUALITY PROTEIN: spexin n=1 Tax=Phodopus roborovskii TaxID=109678 RepID=UPI0021E38534|nr:LOW QUALITY PROTEIN: spexin [Phodopus roborovskii]XP_051031948.1 spexin [Phodopus roborovskii]